MYRRSKSLEILLDVRRQMARDADFDVDLFVEMIRSGSFRTDERSVGVEALEQEEETGNRAA